MKETELIKERNLEERNKKSQEISIKLADLEDDLMELSGVEKGNFFRGMVMALFVWPMISIFFVSIGNGIITAAICVAGLWHYFSWRKKVDIWSDRIFLIAKSEIRELHMRLMYEEDWVSSYDAQLQMAIRNFNSRISDIGYEEKKAKGAISKKDNAEIGNHFYDNRVTKNLLKHRKVKSNAISYSDIFIEKQDKN